MLRLSQLELPLDHTDADLRTAICHQLRIAQNSLLQYRLVKRSVDARRQDDIKLVYSLDLDLDLSASARRQLLKRFRHNPKLRVSPDSRYQFVLPPGSCADRTQLRPVVVGAGPCGYFAALVLAQMGLRPLLLERGKPVKERTADTFGFWKQQTPFNPGSNAQFGEGGAGTFSDGKLYSQVTESEHYIRKVLEEFVRAGANPEILTHHHPHIGSFKLATVVRGMRAEIEALGGEIRFSNLVNSIELAPSTPDQAVADRLVRKVTAVILSDGVRIASEHVVLAVGHSARETFSMLQTWECSCRRSPSPLGYALNIPRA